MANDRAADGPAPVQNVISDPGEGAPTPAALGREGMAERLLDLGRRARAIDASILTDRDLYGDDGTPLA
jgi:hypothetical protein